MTIKFETQENFLKLNTYEWKTPLSYDAKEYDQLLEEVNRYCNENPNDPDVIALQNNIYHEYYLLSDIGVDLDYRQETFSEMKNDVIRKNVIEFYLRKKTAFSVEE